MVSGVRQTEPAEETVEVKPYDLVDSGEALVLAEAKPKTEYPSVEVKPPAAVREVAHAAGGVNLLIGRDADGFQSSERWLNIGDTRLNQLNIGVVGDLGTGKTQLLKSLIYQITKEAAENRDVKPRMLIFDYKGDYSKQEFVDAVGARVIEPYRVPINLFDVTDAAHGSPAWRSRFRFFADILDKIYSGIGPVQRKQLKDAVKQAYDDCADIGRQPTIYDVHASYEMALAGKSDAPMSIIDDLVDMELFTHDSGLGGRGILGRCCGHRPRQARPR